MAAPQLTALRDIQDIEGALRASAEEQFLEPFSLTDDQKKALTTHFHRQIQDALTERSPLEPKWEQWIKNYEGIPDVMRREFPWPNASNLVVPITSTSVDAIYARLMKSLFADPTFWQVRPAISELWKRICEDVVLFLEWARKHDFDLYNTLGDALLQCLKLGTGVIYASHITFSQKTRVLTPDGRTVIRELPVKDGVSLESLSLSDFILPSNARDAQTCRWVCRRKTQLTWGELKDYEAHGWIEGVDKIKEHYATRTDIIKEAERRGVGVETYIRERTYDLHEVYGRYDIDEDGRDEEILLRFHYDSDTYLFGMHNPHVRNIRPFFTLPFFRREYSVYGIGIGEMLEMIQHEITTIHNQRIDNATLANMRCFKMRKGTYTGRTPSKQIYPGKVFMVDEMDDIDSFQLSEVYPSTREAEMMAMSYAERRTGVSDYTLGRESPVVGNRATATSTVALLQQGNTRFDLSLQELQERLGKLGMFVISLYQTNHPEGVKWFKYSQEKGMRVNMLLQLPPEDVYDNLIIDISASSASLNSEIEKQGLIQLLQLLMTYYDKLFQSATMLMPLMMQAPGVAQLMMKAGEGAGELMKRIAFKYDIKNPEQFVPMLSEVLGGGVNPGVAGPGGLQAQPLLGLLASAMLGGAGAPAAGGERGESAPRSVPPQNRGNQGSE